MPKKLYTVHEVACILAEAFGDDCACNFNGNSEFVGRIGLYSGGCALGRKGSVPALFANIPIKDLKHSKNN